MTQEPSLKEKTAKGLFWGGLSNGGQQLLNLVFGIVISRILGPADYGMIGVLTIFSAIAATMQESGFVSALTNRKNISHNDYNAVFWFNILCSITLYILLYLAAPLIARFYDKPELIPLSRLLFLAFVISSFGIAPRAILFRNMKVKENMIISISCLTASGTVGIVLAINGFSYWGLAIQSLVFVTVVTVLNLYFAHWRPSFRVDFTPIKEMFGFSSKLLVTNIFTIINNNLFAVILGRLYSVLEVGSFNQANKWNTMGNTFITGMINGIAQPVFASVSDDKTRQLTIFRKLLRFTAFVSFPTMLGLSLVARELIIITITDKWLSSVYILQMLCIWGAFVPINTLFSNLIISHGRSSVYMTSTIALSILQLMVVYAVYPYGLTWMISAFVAINILWLGVWFIFVRREIGLTFRSMIKDISPYLILAVTLIALTYYITRSIENLYLLLLTRIVMVAALYSLVLWKMKSVIFLECIQFIKKKL